MSDGRSTERLPLSGKTIVVTRRKEQAKEFSDLLERKGATVLLFPAVEIAEPLSWTECDSVFGTLNEYSGIIFTSVNAVEYFFKRAIQQRNRDQIKNIPLFAVGEKTKSVIESYGFHTEEIPSHFSAEQLAFDLIKRPVAGKKFLFPKGNLAKSDLETVLSSSGATVNSITVYETREPQLDAARKRLLNEITECADMITFFSPSSVVHFLHAVSNKIIQTKNVAVFGETTADAARKERLHVVVVAPRSTIETFTEAIQNFYSPLQRK